MGEQMKILIAFAISAMMIQPVLADACVERVRFSQGWDDLYPSSYNTAPSNSNGKINTDHWLCVTKATRNFVNGVVVYVQDLRTPSVEGWLNWPSNAVIDDRIKNALSQ